MKKMTLTLEENEKGAWEVTLDGGGFDNKEVMIILELESAKLKNDILAVSHLERVNADARPEDY